MYEPGKVGDCRVVDDPEKAKSISLWSLGTRDIMRLKKSGAAASPG